MGWCRRFGILSISHETIYRRILKDRKRYAAYDSRGRLAGKRHISERPAAAEACIVTMVERKPGFVATGQLDSRQAAAVTARLQQLIEAQPRPVRTLTLDNGTGFNSYCPPRRY